MLTLVAALVLKGQGVMPHPSSAALGRTLIVGDSILRDANLHGAIRGNLELLLNKRHIQYEMVGSQPEAIIAGLHTGHSETHIGWRIGDVTGELTPRQVRAGETGSLPVWLQDQQPDTVAFMIGTADEPNTETEYLRRYTVLFDELAAYRSNLMVLAVLILPNSPTSRDPRHTPTVWNAKRDALRDAFAAARFNHPALRMVLADAAGNFDPTTMLYDTAHTNLLGAPVVAQTLYRGLSNFWLLPLIPAPEPGDPEGPLLASRSQKEAWFLRRSKA